MNRLAALLLALLVGVTGCGFTQDSAQPQTTTQQQLTPPTAAPISASARTASTPSQLASAVAKTRPLLQESIDGFDDEMCLNVMSRGEEGLALASCTGHSLSMKHTSEALKIQLESLKPRPAETQSLAEETVKELTNLAAAVEMDIPSMIDTSALFAETTLRGWDPYL